MRLKVIAFLLVVATSAAGMLAAEDTNGDHQITVLLPVAFAPEETLPGAHESAWRGEVWIHNASGVGFAHQPTPYGCHIDIVCGIAPGFVGVAESVVSNGNSGGALFFIPEGLAKDVFITNRIHEITGGAQPLGVGMPVVWEGDFLEGTSEYLGIPVAPINRVAIRVYDPFPRAESQVLIEILNAAGEVIESWTLAAKPVPAPDSHPMLPGFDAVYDLVGRFPSLVSEQFIHLRMTPMREGMTYWTLVSVTENSTQHVTLITPR